MRRDHAIHPLLCVLLVAGCAGETGEDDELGAADESESEGTDESEDTGETEGPELGDTPNVQCEAALASLATIEAELASGNPDAASIEAAYVDTALQAFVQQAGAELGRVEEGLLIDDAAISSALASGDPLDLIDAHWRMLLVSHLFIRHELGEVAATLPDPANDPALLYARWDAAWCWWDGALRPLAEQADALGPEADTIVATIDEGFAAGHAGIEGAESWAIDEWVVPAAKQQVEKTLYVAFHRLVHAWSLAALDAGSPDEGARLARMAHGAFQPLEDRMLDRNTPGIAIIEAQLLDDPALIDPAALLREMNVAFAKRTRKYCDHALPELDGTIGTAPGYTGAVEGRTYARLIDVYMVDALPGFDLAAHRASWDAWVAAVESEDLVAAEAVSAELVDWVCQYQAALGIAECTSSADEPAP